MKEIPVDEVAAISAEIYQDAVRIGCTEVSITGQIWPGGKLNGRAEEAARFVEYSWLRAAVVDGRAIFEDSDPKRFAALLNTYGIGEDPYTEPASEDHQDDTVPTPNPARPASKVELTANVLPATLHELERQAKAAGISIGDFLDWKFQAPNQA